jgi:saccharopine dehydrogenase-like NADP-dependent oxidoreductase
MISIAVLGAGRSAGYFIDYTINLCKDRGWRLTIADMQTSHLEKYQADFPSLALMNASLNEQNERLRVIEGADWVVSLLPAFMHVDVAKDCLIKGCNLATASYVSEEMQELGAEAEKKGLIFLNECGLDPGIDHMSAVKIINDLRANGAEIIGYKSYCGGLIAPQFNDNPWKYKFSWNPRNVILAGNGVSTALLDGEIKVIPYHHNFQRPEEILMPDDSAYEAYINRDSLSYQSIYDLEDVKTMVRGTLRYPGYCRAWNILIHLGLTDNSYKYPLSEGMTYKEFLCSFLLGNNHTDIIDSIRQTIGMPDYEQDAIDKVLWTGLNSNEIVPTDTQGSPAAILQNLLEKKWLLKEDDHDLVVMQHQVKFTLEGETKMFVSSLHLEGEGRVSTAMSKTVGLPLAIAVKTLIDNPSKKKGIVIPIYKGIYEPVLEELKSFGVEFSEKVISLSEPVTESKPE